MKRLFFLVMVFLVIIGLLSCTKTTPKFILNLVSNPLIGGIVQGQGEYEADEEINITAIANEGYDFINWTNEDDDVISTLAAFLFIMPSNDATLTANFILKTYTVTFDNNGGDTQADPQTIDVYHGNSVNSLPFPPTKINHGFLGWNTQADGNGDEFTEDTIVTNDITVYAQWGIDMYTVTFDNNGGDTQANPQTIAVEHGGSIDSLPVPPTRIGHTFDEWNIEQDGSGDEFTVDTIVENDITVYAKWKINMYTVTFDNNGGDTQADPQTIDVEHGGSIDSLPVPPTKIGYTFDEWNIEQNGSGDEFTVDTIVENNITVYAKWKINMYTVTFDNNGGDTQADPQTIDVDHGNSVNSLPFPPTKVNHGFLGWNTQADGNGDEFTEDTIVTDDITVYAKWGIDMYTVTFDNNGGDTQANPQTIAVEHGGSIDSLPVPPTRIGHTFVEWNIEQDGSGDEFTVDTIVENDITVYAQWAINQYTVTTEVVPAGSGNVIGAGDYNYDSQVELTANPNVDHDFVRWVDEDDNELSSNNPYIFSMPANDIHVKAVFREFEVGENAIYKIGVIDFNMVFAPAAIFPIGFGAGIPELMDWFIPPDGNKEVENPFWIGETTVTYELWYTVRKWAEDNGYTFANEGSEGSMGVDGAAPTTNRNHPVTRVSWRDAIVWCNALSEMMNLDPLYRYFYLDSCSTLIFNNPSKIHGF